MAQYGHILPFFQHDSLIESILLLENKLHVVTKPGLVTDIGASGIHDYTTTLLSVAGYQDSTLVSRGFRSQSFREQLSEIQKESKEHMISFFTDVFHSFHVSKSRKAMLKRMFRRPD
jgi:hypothetical protein